MYFGRNSPAKGSVMMRSDLIVKLEDIIEPATVSLGYKLWGIEISGSGKGGILLQVYIDCDLPDALLIDDAIENTAKGKGVTLADCVKVSRQINALLDVEDVIPDGCVLEVSSPGMDRLLFKVEHYQQFINSLVKIKLRISVAGQRVIVGTIKTVIGDKIEIISDDKTVELSLDNIVKANLLSNS